MSFFKKIPQNYFAILSKKDRDIYYTALLLLWKEIKTSYQIDRNDYLNMLIVNFESRLMEIEIEEEESYLSNLENRNITSYANYVIKRLENTGWIEIEDDYYTFKEYISLPNFSQRIICLLEELDVEQNKEYNKYVYTVYRSLNTICSDKNDYIYLDLLRAFQVTESLLNTLNGLYNDLKRYYKQLIFQDEVKDLVSEHFEKYFIHVTEQLLHPLKTFDSLNKFKIPIIEILRQWMSDNNIKLELAESALKNGYANCMEEAIDDINTKINILIDRYETDISLLMNIIDEKNTIYVRAFVDKIRYLVNTDNSIKGKLNDIIKHVVKGDNKFIEKALVNSIVVDKQYYLNEKSLKVIKRRLKKIEFACDVEDEIPNDELNNEFSKVKESLNSKLTYKQALLYINNQMGDNMELSSENISIKNVDEFVLLVMAAMKASEKKSNYTIEYSEGQVGTRKYTIPKFTIKKKKV